MLSIIALTMQGPAKGGVKFSAKSLIQGNYSVEIKKNQEKQENIWKGEFKAVNGSSTTEIKLFKPIITTTTTEKKIKGKMTPVTTNTTTYEDLNESHIVKLEAANDLSLKITLDEQTFLDAELTQNKEENVYKYETSNETHYITYTVYNGLYSVLQITDKATHEVIDLQFKKQREQVKQNKWMMLLQPLMMIITQFISSSMKKKQMAKLQGAEENTQAEQKVEVGKESDNKGEQKEEKKEEKKEKKSKKEVQEEKKLN